MKYGGTEVKLQAFLTSELGGNERAVSLSDRMLGGGRPKLGLCVGTCWFVTQILHEARNLQADAGEELLSCLRHFQYLAVPGF